MNIEQITEYLWNNSDEVSFGNSTQWDMDTFTSKWFEKNKYKRIQKANGLYWFSVKGMSINDFKNLNTPIDLPKNGADFAKVSKEVSNLFNQNICGEIEEELVFYNGHANTVFDRIRTHFALNNDKTGALAIGKYSNISKYEFKVRIFHHEMKMDELDRVDADYIRKLLKHKIGREAIESCWRAKYGWPILCER